MLCKSCGKKVDINKKFCTNCGWKIEVPVAKEEVKKVIPKEPIQEVKRINKDESVAREEALLKNEFDNFKSGIKKQSKKNKNFINSFSSNLKKQSLTSEVEKKVVKNKFKGFSKPLFGVSLFAIIGTLIFIAERERKAEIKRPSEGKEYSYINQYLKSDGNCCNEKLSSGISIDGKLSVLNKIILKNPNDSEALIQRAKVYESKGFFNSKCLDLEKASLQGNQKAKSQYSQSKYDWEENKWRSCKSEREDSNNYVPAWKLKGIEKQPKWINNGKYSFNSNGIDIDFVHFNSFGAITYEAPIREDKSNVDDEYFYDYQINVACYSGEIYSWEDNKWITPKTKNKKSLVKAICKEKDNDPAIIPLLISSGWKKYSNDHWVNVNGWEEDESTEYKDFDTNYYKTSDQELSQISVDCSDDMVAVVKKGEWTKYKNAKGIFKEMLNDKCGLSSSSLKSSSNLIEWERDNGQSVIFDPSTLKGYREDWYDEDKRARRRLNYKYIVEDKDGESKEYRVYLWCRKYKAALEEDGTDMYDSSGGYRWLGLRKSDTYAKREAVKIIKDFCPKFKEIETRTVNRYFSDEV